MVDSFNGHNIGDVSNEDFKASIDFEMKELRPAFSSDTFMFTHDSSGSSANTAKTGDILTLAYSSANLVVQPLASNTETINPLWYNSTQRTIDIESTKRCVDGRRWKTNCSYQS